MLSLRLDQRVVRGLRPAIIAAVFFLLVCWRLTAAPVADFGADWSKRIWQVEDGLPAANVAGIGQTSDGYLWLATQSGLARFDGARFEQVPIPVGSARPIIRVMLCDHAENLWLAEPNGVVVRFNVREGTARMFAVTNGLPNALALNMVETPDYAVWISYADGSVYRILPDDSIDRITAANGLNDDGICSLTLDSCGVLWFAKGFQFGFLRGRHFEKIGELAEPNAQILGARNGGLWFCTGSQLLKSTTNGAPVAVAYFRDEPSRLRPSALFEDFGGRLWIGTAADGLFQLDRTNLFKIKTSHNKIRTIVRDHEGSIWVGTDGGGLNRLQPRAIRLHGRDEGLPFETVRSLDEDGNGDLWVVTQNGDITRLSATNWSNVRKIENWAGGSAHCVVADLQGAMWIGTNRRGLFRWKDGNFSRFGVKDGLGAGAIRSLMVDSRNDLWIGLETAGLVQRLLDGKFQSFPLPVNSRSVHAIAEDSSGRIWLGTSDGRLLRVDGDKLSEIAHLDPEMACHIRCLSATADGSLWIGYAVHGVGRLQAGKFSLIGPENGLLDGNICALMPDAAGRMWFASDRGIFYAGLDKLNDVADGRAGSVQSVFYGRDSGLPNLQAYYGYCPNTLTARSGEILFSTHSGITVVYPDHVRANAMPPIVLIQSVAVDGKIIAREENHATGVPSNHRKIEVAFTAASFIAPEQVRFRYRLSGWNNDWVEVERGHPAVYDRLPPGEYTFQVAACNNCGVWSEKDASFTFIVPVSFWQSWLFRTLVMLIFLTVLVAGVRHRSLRRVREMIRKMEQQAALQKERTRIAEDMHDELGARFTQISLLGELSRNALGEPAKAHDYLGQVSQLAQVGVKSLDEIVWAVNPRNDTLRDLLDYAGQYALDFGASAGLQCRLDFPDAPLPRVISGDIRHAVFLIIKEALHNVVKHAQATQVKLFFEINETGMRLRIEDNGKGFAPSPENALDDGLRNIRRRTAALDGQVEIASHPGAGTCVTVTLPLPK